MYLVRILNRKFMKKLHLCGLLPLLLILTACPAHTDQPIDTGSYKVPPWLLGEWTGDNRSLGKEHYILEQGSKKTEFKCYSVDSTGKKSLHNDHIIMSTVGGKVFVSAHDPEGGYYLFELEKQSETTFLLKEIDEDVYGESLKTDASSSEIKKFIEKNLKDGDIMGTETKYVKVK